MNLIPQNSQSMEEVLPIYRGRMVAQPGQQIDRQERRAIQAQNRAGRVAAHGLEVSEQIFNVELEVFTRSAIRTVQSLGVIGESISRAEARDVAIERQYCEIEPGAIPDFVRVRQQLSMQRGEILDVVGQHLMRKLDEVGRLRG